MDFGLFEVIGAWPLELIVSLAASILFALVLLLLFLFFGHEYQKYWLKIRRAAKDLKHLVDEPNDPINLFIEKVIERLTGEDVNPDVIVLVLTKVLEIMSKDPDKWDDHIRILFEKLAAELDLS